MYKIRIHGLMQDCSLPLSFNTRDGTVCNLIGNSLVTVI